MTSCPKDNVIPMKRALCCGAIPTLLPLSLRGLGRGGIRVRQDIPTGHIGNLFLDPALLREVQVTRGALSSRYGDNAMGGAVSCETSLELRNLADKTRYRPDGGLGDGRSLLVNLSLQW